MRKKKKTVTPEKRKEEKKPVPAPPPSAAASKKTPAARPPKSPETTHPGPSIGPRTISIRPENHKEESGKKSEPGKIFKEDFTQEQLDKVWNYFTESIGKQYPNFYSSVAGRNLLLKSDHTVSLTVDNKLQELEIHHKRQEILDFLRDELSNHLINMETVVVESEGNGKPYSPEEKFKTMAEKNPLIKELKDKLDMELDY